MRRRGEGGKVSPHIVFLHLLLFLLGVDATGQARGPGEIQIQEKEGDKEFSLSLPLFFFRRHGQW